MNYNDISFFKSNVDKTNLYNTCTDHIGYHYVRILKTFESRSRSNWNGKIFLDKDNVNDQSLLKKFPLRFYLPVDSLAQKSKENAREGAKGDFEDPRIKHLVIMINGLDEYEEYYLKQYDFLGASFAEKNIASVLLSTPFHLHRTVKYCPKSDLDCIKSENTEKGKIYKPSDVILDDWQNIFHMYDATYNDIQSIVRKIRNCNEAKTTDSDFSFYKTHFSPDTKISLLGYSLGGLISFGFFLQNSIEIDKLILFNTPGSLEDASTRFIHISSEKWISAINYLKKKEDELIELLGNKKLSIRKRNKDVYIRHFLRLMTHTSYGTIETKIDATKEKILQIMCGGDKVIDMKPWSLYFDEDSKNSKLVHKKISQHIFSGVGHNPILETRGSELMPNISRIMTDHILNDENTTHWQEKEIEDAIMGLIRGTETYNELKNDLNDPGFHKTFTVKKLNYLLQKEFTDDITKQKRFLKFYYLSKMYFPKFYDLIEKNKKKDERHK